MGWLDADAHSSPIECDFCRRRTRLEYKGKRDAKTEAKVWFASRCTTGRTSCPLCALSLPIAEAIQSANLTHVKATSIDLEFWSDAAASAPPPRPAGPQPDSPTRGPPPPPPLERPGSRATASLLDEDRATPTAPSGEPREGEAAGPEETPQPQDIGTHGIAYPDVTAALIEGAERYSHNSMFDSVSKIKGIIKEPSAGGEPSAGEPAAEPASHSGSAPAQATAAARPLPASPAAGPAPVPPVPTPAPPASPTDHSSHSSHTRPPPFNVSSLGDGRELRGRTRAPSLLPAADAPCPERVDLLERRVDQLEAQVSYLASALQSIQLGGMPLA